MPKTKLELLNAKADRMRGNGEQVPQDLLDEIRELEGTPVVVDTRNRESQARTTPRQADVPAATHPIGDYQNISTMMEEIRVDWPQASIDMFLTILRTHPRYKVEVIERFRQGRGDSDRKYGTLIIRAEWLNTF